MWTFQLETYTQKIVILTIIIKWYGKIYCNDRKHALSDNLLKIGLKCATRPLVRDVTNFSREHGRANGCNWTLKISLWFGTLQTTTNVFLFIECSSEVPWPIRLLCSLSRSWCTAYRSQWSRWSVKATQWISCNWNPCLEHRKLF